MRVFIVVQRSNTEPATAAAEPDSNFCYLCNNLDYAAVNFCHNHPPPPCTPRDLPKKFLLTLTLLHHSFCPGGGREFVEVVPKGQAFSINDVCHFWNFNHHGRNWRLTTLWGLFVALKLYTFLKTMIQS